MFKIISPKISATFQKKHRGETAIAWDGKVLGVGKDALVALKTAKKKMPDIESKRFLVFRVHHPNEILVM